MITFLIRKISSPFSKNINMFSNQTKLLLSLLCPDILHFSLWMNLSWNATLLNIVSHLYNFTQEIWKIPATEIPTTEIPTTENSSLHNYLTTVSLFHLSETENQTHVVIRNSRWFFLLAAISMSIYLFIYVRSYPTIYC